MTRSRYVLQSHEHTFYGEIDGAIITTADPSQATAFVDVDAAVQRAQALISVGFPVYQVVSVNCCAYPETGKPVKQIQAFF